MTPCVSARHPVIAGMAYMVAASVLLAGLDAMAKYLGAAYPVTEVVWFRYAAHLGLALAVTTPTRGVRVFASRAPRLQAVRSVLLLGTSVLFFLALRYLPLAETAALTFSAPVITVALAGPLLGEQVTRTRAGIALLGFCGVVAVAQPLSATFGLPTLLPVATAVATSVYSILTRRLGAIDRGPTTWVYTGLAGTVLMLATAPFGWQMPDPRGLVLFLVLGLLGGLGHLALINAYMRVPASVIAPLGYLELAWATLLGIALFGEIPNGIAIAGMLAIGTSGLLIARGGRDARQVQYFEP